MSLSGSTTSSDTLVAQQRGIKNEKQENNLLHEPRNNEISKIFMSKQFNKEENYKSSQYLEEYLNITK